MKYGVVYLLRCKSNGKGYVGQTTRSLAIRWQEHQLGGHCRLLSYAIRKYTSSSFDVFEIDTAETQVELDRKEQEWIVKLRTRAPTGYNLSEGGSGGRPSDETRRLQSLAGRGRPKTEEHRRKISLANKGKKRSTQSCENNSQAQKGLKRAPSSVARSKAGYREKHLRKLAAGIVRGVLQEKDVWDILNEHRQGTNHTCLARKYGVNRTTVQHITHGRRWRHIYEAFKASSSDPPAFATSEEL